MPVKISVQAHRHACCHAHSCVIKGKLHYLKAKCMTKMELQNVLHKPSFKHVSNDACLENGTVECASRPSCYHVGYVIVCIANHLNIQTVKPLLVTGMVIYFDLS